MKEPYDKPTAAYQSVRKSVARLSGYQEIRFDPDILVADVPPTVILMY